MAVRMVTLTGDTPEAWRLALSLFGHGSSSALLDRRGGLAPAGSMAPGSSPAHLGAGSDSMSGALAPFVGWVDGTSGASQGGYIVHSTEWENLTFDPGEASVDRIDRVIIQCRDNAYDSSGFTDARVRILKGNSGGGATDLPASSELLWEVSVPAGASVGGGGFNITERRTDKRRWTAANGGLLLVKDAADRATLTAHEGMQIWRLDAGDRQVYRGGVWAWDGAPRVAQKFSTEEVFNNTYQPDDALTIAVPAGGYFDVEVLGNYAADTDFDIKLGFTGPTGSGMTWVVLGKGGTTQPDGALGQVDWITQDITGEPRLGGRVTTDNTSPMAFFAKGTLYSGNGGNITLRWAQDATGGGAPTKMLPGSRMTVTRVGAD